VPAAEPLVEAKPLQSGASTAVCAADGGASSGTSLAVIRGMDITMAPPSPAPRSDQAIRDEVDRVLAWRGRTDLGATVASGTVVVAGEVDSWSQRRNLADVLACIDGVAHVVNRLVVRAPPLQASALRDAITDALARRAMRTVQRLQFEIDGGRVVVAGVAGSESERAAVLGAIAGTRGTIAVDDKLRIAPFQRRDT
jgi:osmotically-inducible protein OsmY